jgi:hypothetical protein
MIWGTLTVSLRLLPGWQVDSCAGMMYYFTEWKRPCVIVFSQNIIQEFRKCPVSKVDSLYSQ